MIVVSMVGACCFSLVSVLILLGCDFLCGHSYIEVRNVWKQEHEAEMLLLFVM